MSIERLRALENDIEATDRLVAKSRKLNPDIMYGRVFIKHRDTILSLIAELGQEVGAVAWTKDAEAYGNALNEAAWKFVEECPEKSALLFSNTKKPLRAAILTYAEHVARATSPAHTSEARDAELWRFCNGTHELENGEVAKMHVNVGVNVWRGENWLAYHECSPDEAREVINGIAAMRQEGGTP